MSLIMRLKAYPRLWKVLRGLAFPIRVIRVLRIIYYEVFVRDMPMKVFADYDDYWSRREQEGKVAKCLYRYEYIVRRVPPRGKLLDIGCGEGSFLEYVRKHRPWLELAGIDQSTRAIETTRGKGFHAIRFVLGTDRFDDHNLEADFVVLMEILEHLPNAEETLLQAGRIAKQLIFLSVPNLGYFINRLRLLTGRVPITNVIYHIKEHVRFWTYHDLRLWCEELGFEVVDISGQYGLPLLWRWWPSLFASGLVAEIKAKQDRQQ